MSETTILDARAEAVLRTWKAEHPRVADATVSHVDGAVYRIETLGAVYRAEVLDGATRVAFALADPADVSIDLAPPILRRLVGEPEAVPVPTLGLDPAV